MQKQEHSKQDGQDKPEISNNLVYKQGTKPSKHASCIHKAPKTN